MNYATARRIVRVGRRSTGEAAPGNLQDAHLLAQSDIRARRLRRSARKARTITRRFQ